MNMKREYLEYVNGEYTEVRNFLKEKDGVVDLDKHRMIFDKLTMPYGSWVETKKAAGEPGKKETLADIIGMYGLIDDHGLLKLKNYLEHGFEDLVDDLGAHGYRYNRAKGAFVPPWNGVKK